MLFDALQVALDVIDPATGIGQVDADEAGVLITVRGVDGADRVVVRLAEGTLQGPGIGLTVVAAGSAVSNTGTPAARSRSVA